FISTRMEACVLSFKKFLHLSLCLAAFPVGVASASYIGTGVVGLGPGLTDVLGTTNGSPVIPGGTIYLQVTPVAYSANHTVASGEAGSLLIGTGSTGFTFTLPAVNSAGFQQGQTVCFVSQLTGAAILTIASSSTVNGPASLVTNGQACAISDVTNSAWQVSGTSGLLSNATALGSEFTVSSS